MEMLQDIISLCMIFVASGLFGTMFVPMKKFNPGDGLFAQWLMCLAIWLVGFGMFAWTGYQHFYPLAMVGGVSWCLGNLAAVPIIEQLGLGLSLLMFSVMNTTTCFVVSTFGLLGTEARPAQHLWLTVVGLIMVMAGAVVAALISGVLYGLNTVPIVAIQDNPSAFRNVERGGMPYVFSQFSGILLTSTAAFVIYAIVKRNKPSINPEVALPSLLSGLMWGVAQAMSIVALEHLSQAIAGPITAMVPGCVATLWSLYFFKEIEEGKNLYVLWSAISVTVGGAVLIGLSKLSF